MRRVVKETPERSDIVQYAQNVAAAPLLPGAGTAWSLRLETPEYIGCAPNTARLAPLSVPMMAIGGVPYCSCYHTLVKPRTAVCSRNLSTTQSSQ